MVDGDMLARLRPLFGVLAFVALAALGLAVPVVERDAAGGEGTELSAHVASSLRRAIPERTERLFSAPVPGAGTILVLALACSATGLVGRQRRRVGDVGDDWRSLLLGAPPGPA